MFFQEELQVILVIFLKYLFLIEVKVVIDEAEDIDYYVDGAEHFGHQAVDGLHHSIQFILPAQVN